MSQNLFVENDGLPCPDVGSWAETKYRLLALYDELFSTGMKYKWDQRVYIDLYAGAGYARVKGTKKILKGSPILALTVTHPFDKYIFCEENLEKLNALEVRAQRIAPDAKVGRVGAALELVPDHAHELVSSPRRLSSSRRASIAV